MSKVHTQFICSHCQYVSLKWIGQCPDCKMWNTLLEGQPHEVLGGSGKLSFQTKDVVAGVARQVSSLSSFDIHQINDDRYRVLSEELSRVFGGGITTSSVTLLAGEPGIGKSTLTLALALELSENQKVVYVTGEEAAHQIVKRAGRISSKQTTLGIVQENVVEHVIATLQEERPEIAIIDSIQVMYSASLGSVSGSIGQIRFVTELLIEMAKNLGITLIIIGHVTKDGSIAGPKVLEHLVDTVLVLEGDTISETRFLRAEKNRFGPTDEVGVFQMKQHGFEEVKNPSELFLLGRRDGASGSVITTTMEGSRSFLIEVQALTTYTKFGYPKRSSTGYIQPRLELVLAVITKYCQIAIDSSDVFVNVVGGLRVKDPSIDLAVLIAVVSSRKNKPLPKDIVVCGEIGLTGEVRAVSHIEKRMKEAQKQGCTKMFVPASQVDQLKKSTISIVGIRTVEDALSHILGG